MHLTGENFIGATRTGTGSATFRALSPVTGEALDGNFNNAGLKDLESAAALAASAFSGFRDVLPAQRADFLDAIAEEIVALGDVLLERCCAESGLPLARITGERGRTCGQLALFANLLRDGWYTDARIDTAQPGRLPLPKSDIRRMLVPLGPVAVFGASNFPLAFSTAGGDTASALAAGCPVIVKGHPSHPGTHELVSSAIIKAAERTGMPDGVFSALNLSRENAIALVTHPTVKAVGFTGSRAAGMTLFNAAVSRPEPIPVYAEMSAVNPVILLAGAITAHRQKLAKDLAGSVVLGAGQFCTNPGLVLLLKSTDSAAFLTEFSTHIEAAAPAVMLNKGIADAYRNGLATLRRLGGVESLAVSAKEASGNEGAPSAYTVAATEFLGQKKLSEEIFGPVTLFVLCENESELITVIENLEGQLTATIHSEKTDEVLAAKLLSLVTQKAGRIIFGGFPTGVEVCHSMQHGGPFPSTTDSRSTSVGTAAIYRFLRPVAYQDVPDHLLPPALQNSNPLNLLRLVDGSWTQQVITF